MATEAIRALVLVVGVGHDTEAALAGASGEAELHVERAPDPAGAIAWLESGDQVDVVLVGADMAEPVRLAQRLHSLDRNGSVVILVRPEHEDEVRHALEVAPFLGGDVGSALVGDPGLGELLTDAARRSQARRESAAERKRRRETPPPLSARYLGTLLDSAPIGIVTLDANGAVIGWNKRADQMLGVPEVEALGRPFADLWPASERDRLATLVDGLESGGLGDPGEAFERDAHAFEITGARFTIRSGESGSILVLQDVTKRVAAERELQLQKALLEAQAESSVAGITVVSPDDRLELVNRRFAEIWQLDPEVVVAPHEARARVREHILAQVADPDAFMRVADVLADDPDRDHRDEIRLLDGRTIERYSTIARGADGGVVGRVWFFTDITERKRDEESLRFLAEATEVLYSSLDYETTLRRVADLAIARVSDWCSVQVEDEAGRRSIAVAHPDPAKVALARELQERYPADAEASGIADAIRAGRPQIFREVTDELLVAAARDDEHLRLLRELGLRSMMVVPMRSRGHVLGHITFANSESGRALDDDDLELADELARRAALAIDNARVHAELRATARTLQESLLPPHLPVIPGVELAARFRPAGTGIDVGGDFYDIFEGGPGRWTLAIGDVCGKGAEAAALTALTRYTVRAAAMYEEGPARVVRVLNEALLRQRQDFRFTTLVCCTLDLRGGGASVRVTAAGHPQPLVLRASGEAEVAAASGPLLGVLADASFSETELELGSGDTLVLYTDGLTDAAAPERQLAEEDLLAALREAAGLGPAELMGRLEELAVADPSVEPRDDIALLALRLAAEG
jgi:PAS domain S-box-containing protein